MRDRIAYVNGVVAVKNSNGYSEQYDIYLSSERFRLQGFVASCRPARF